MSLRDVMRFLILLLHREGIDLSFQERSRWHALFYELKQLPPTAGVPVSVRDAFFDWNGPVPVCQNLGNGLNVLFVTGCVEWSLPDMRTYVLSKRAIEIWAEEFDGLREGEKDFLQRVALGYARKHFTAMAAA